MRMAGVGHVPQAYLAVGPRCGQDLAVRTKGYLVDSGGEPDQRLAKLPRTIPVTMGRVGYHPQAVTLVVEPVDALNPVLAAVREATDAAGCDGQTDTDPWTPHVSVAYSHSDGPAVPIIDALGHWLPKTEVTIKSISLVSQTQVGHSWQWQPVAEVHLTGDQVATSNLNNP